MLAADPQNTVECYLVVPPQYRPQLYTGVRFLNTANLKAFVSIAPRYNRNLIDLANGRTDVYPLSGVRNDLALSISGSDAETEQVIDEIIRRNIPVYIYPKVGGNVQLNMPLVRGLGTDPLDATVTYTLTTSTGTTVYMPHGDSGHGLFLKAIDTTAPVIDGVQSDNGVLNQLPTGRGMPFFKKRENLFLDSLISEITSSAPYAAGLEWGAYTSAADVWGTDHGIKTSPWCEDANSYWSTSTTTTLRSYDFTTVAGVKNLSFCYRVDGVMNVSLKDSGGVTQYSANITTGSGRIQLALSGLVGMINAYIEVTLSSGSFMEFSCPQLISTSSVDVNEYLPFLGTTSSSTEAEITACSLKVELDMGADNIASTTTSADRDGAVIASAFVQPMWGADYKTQVNCIFQLSGYDNNTWVNLSYDGSTGPQFDLYFGGASRDTAAISGHVLGDVYVVGLWSGYSDGTAATRVYAVRLRDGTTYTCDYADSMMWPKQVQIGYELAGGNQADAVLSGFSVQSSAWGRCRDAIDRLADSVVSNVMRTTIGRWYLLSKETSPKRHNANANQGQYTARELRAI